MRFLVNIPFFATLASAQYLVESSSFGQSGKISPNKYAIPGWHVSGEGQVPQLLSDKIILTPPHPGNARGAVWSESKVAQSDWVAELDFRASGPDRGSGNLQIWYTKDGREGIGASSLYTVGSFDGMVLSIDQYGGRGGTIRGFMNDGNTNFKTHYSVDSLAFGHCDYAYRNLGRISKLKIRQEHDVFEVIIDDRLCFSSDKIRLPADYSFGVTAASAETPDSFEVYKFLLYTSRSVTREEPRRDQPPSFQQQSDTRASSYQSSQAQFEDLHDRLQTIAHAIEKLDIEISNHIGESDHRHREISRGLMTRETINHITGQSDKLDRIERIVNSFQGQISNLQGAVKDSHLSMTEGLPKHMSDIITTNGPRMGLLIFVFVVVQVMLVGVYTVYKRRIKQGPKKYL
ncbi:MAG: hypothetical protein Q9164_000807 [Protoblastenia rupestris]